MENTQAYGMIAFIFVSLLIAIYQFSLKETWIAFAYIMIATLGYAVYCLEDDRDKSKRGKLKEGVKE